MPRIEQLGYNEFRYLIAYDSDCNEFLISDDNHPRGGESYRLNDEGIKNNEISYKINHPFLTQRQRFKQRIYTTKTYKDVFNYYKKKQDTKL